MVIERPISHDAGHAHIWQGVEAIGATATRPGVAGALLPSKGQAPDEPGGRGHAGHGSVRSQLTVWSCTPPLGAFLLPHKGAGRMDALSLWCVYQNTLANAAPRAMARLHVTLALWIRQEASNARSRATRCRWTWSVGEVSRGVCEASGWHIAQLTPMVLPSVVASWKMALPSLMPFWVSAAQTLRFSIGVMTVDASLRRRFRGGRPCGSLNHVGPVQLGMVTVSLLHQNVHRCQAQCGPFLSRKVF